MLGKYVLILFLNVFKCFFTWQASPGNRFSRLAVPRLIPRINGGVPRRSD